MFRGAQVMAAAQEKLGDAVADAVKGRKVSGRNTRGVLRFSSLTDATHAAREVKASASAPPPTPPTPPAR